MMLDKVLPFRQSEANYPQFPAEYYELTNNAMSVEGAPPRRGDICLVRVGKEQPGEPHMIRTREGRFVCGFLCVEEGGYALDFPNPEFSRFPFVKGQAETIGQVECFFCATAGDVRGGLYLPTGYGHHENLRTPDEPLHVISEFSDIPLSRLVNWRADVLGNVMEISSTWNELIGADVSEAAGRGFANFIHPMDRDDALKKWADSLETGRPFSVRCRLRAKGGYMEAFVIATKTASGWLGTTRFS